MSINYYVRSYHIDGKPLSVENQKVSDVECPGSHYVHRWMEKFGYPASGPEGTVGQVAEVTEDLAVACNRHIDLLNHFQRMLECEVTVAPNGEQVCMPYDTGANWRAQQMSRLLTFIVESQKVAIKFNLPILYTLAWS